MTENRRRADPQAANASDLIRPPSSVVCRPIAGRLVIATHNLVKLAEKLELLPPHGVDAVSAGELGLGEPEETGMTFRANARIKAETPTKASALPGLCGPCAIWGGA